MLRETGRVVAVEQGAVWVETIRSSACGRCAARAGCGHGALAGSLGTGKGLIRVQDGPQLAAIDCELGDDVEIELPESAVLIASAIVYGLPLLAGTASAVVAARWGDLAAIVGFIAGLGIGFLAARYIAGRAGPDATFEPRLVACTRLAESDLIVRTFAG